MARQPSQSKPKLYYGWVIIMVTATLQFAGGTPTFPVLGLFLKPETAELGWSAASYAAPLTIGTILGGFAGALTGPAMDKYGPRWIMTIAAVLVGGCFMLMGFVHHLWQYFVLAIITRGVTAGCFFMVVGIVIPRWFISKRGKATALSGLGGSLGQFLNPIMVEFVISHFGWRPAWAAMGLLVWVGAILPVFLFLKNKPEDMGLLPDGMTSEQAAQLKADSAKPQLKGARRVVRDVSLTGKQALRTHSFYLMLLAQCAISLVISGLHFHWFSYMTSKGLSSSVAVASISISSLASIPSTLLAGYLADRFPLRFILLTTYVGFALSVTILLFTNSPAMAYAYGISLGIFSGMAFTINTVVWADYYGRKHLGAIRGLTSPVNQITNASGPLVASLALDATGNYSAILTVFIIVASLGSLCWIVATPPKIVETEPEPAPAR